MCLHTPPYIGEMTFGFQDTFVNVLPIRFLVILKVVRAHQGTGRVCRVEMRTLLWLTKKPPIFTFKVLKILFFEIPRGEEASL